MSNDGASRELKKSSQPGYGRLLARLGLHRPELRAWALYDWANSAVVTTIIAAVFPIYFYRVAGANLPEGTATQRFATATLIAMAALALLAPVLGVLADSVAIKKKLLGLFLGIGAPATAAMFFIHTGDWLLAPDSRDLLRPTDRGQAPVRTAEQALA